MSRAAQKPKKTQRKPKGTETLIEQKAQPPSKPRGEPPGATVVSRHGTSLVTREARGFSGRELASVGLNFKQARNDGIQVDLRRRSILEKNVVKLKSWWRPPRRASGPAKVPKGIEHKKVGTAKTARRAKKKAEKRAGRPRRTRRAA